MVSRCASLGGLAVLRPFPISKITIHRSQEARDEFRRLDLLRAQTIATSGSGAPIPGEEGNGNHVSDISTLFLSEGDGAAAKELLDNICRAPRKNVKLIAFTFPPRRISERDDIHSSSEQTIIRRPGC